MEKIQICFPISLWCWYSLVFLCLLLCVFLTWNLLCSLSLSPVWFYLFCLRSFAFASICFYPFFFSCFGFLLYCILASLFLFWFSFWLPWLVSFHLSILFVSVCPVSLLPPTCGALALQVASQSAVSQEQVDNILQENDALRTNLAALEQVMHLEKVIQEPNFNTVSCGLTWVRYLTLPCS